MTAPHVAQASRLQPRYVEEWLKGMTCAGYLVYDPAAETFQLADENAFLLASEGTDHFMGGLFLFAPALLRVAPMVAEAFEKGGGVAFDEIGADGIEALDWLNCGQYEHRLISQWLNMLPDVVDRLKQRWSRARRRLWSWPGQHCDCQGVPRLRSRRHRSKPTFDRAGAGGRRGRRYWHAPAVSRTDDR
jgi:Rv2258c-like winged HTH domain